MAPGAMGCSDSKDDKPPTNAAPPAPPAQDRGLTFTANQDKGRYADLNTSIPWKEVEDYWKTEDGKIFDVAKLQQAFPVEFDDASKAERTALFKLFDYDGSGKVTLAEFGGGFNKRCIDQMTKGGAQPSLADSGKCGMYRYSYRVLIRPFNLANGIGGGKGADGATIEKGEMRVLMIAAVACLQILRLFDVADSGNDCRINNQEWAKNLGKINKCLQDIAPGSQEVTQDDFSKVKRDGESKGNLLLKEVVDYFLGHVCSDPKVLQECEKEKGDYD